MQGNPADLVQQDSKNALDDKPLAARPRGQARFVSVTSIVTPTAAANDTPYGVSAAEAVVLVDSLTAAERRNAKRRASYAARRATAVNAAAASDAPARTAPDAAAAQASPDRSQPVGAPAAEAEATKPATARRNGHKKKAPPVPNDAEASLDGLQPADAPASDAEGIEPIAKRRKGRKMKAIDPPFAHGPHINSDVEEDLMDLNDLVPDKVSYCTSNEQTKHFIACIELATLRSGCMNRQYVL